VKKSIIILLLSLGALSTYAQQGWEAGGWIGTSAYFGDLNTQFNLSSPGLAGGLIARYNFNNRLCLKFSANYIRISANDANSDKSSESEF